MKINYRNQQIKLKKQKIINLNLEIKKLEFEKEKILNENNISYTIFFGIISIILGFLFSEIINARLKLDIYITIFGKIVFCIFLFGIIVYLYIKSIKPSLKKIEEINKIIEIKNKELLNIIYK